MDILTDVHFIPYAGYTDDHVPVIQPLSGEPVLTGYACYKDNGKLVPYEYSMPRSHPKASACMAYMAEVIALHPEWLLAINSQEVDGNGW